MRPYHKSNKSKKGWEGVAQEVECCPSNHETLISTPNTTKKKNK
jgi:hypothetical protein